MQRLRDHERDHAVGCIKKDVGVGDVAIGGGAGDPLHDSEREKCGHRKEERVTGDFELMIDPLACSPGDDKGHGGSFEGKDGPGLDGAEGEWREEQNNAACAEEHVIREAGASRA